MMLRVLGLLLLVLAGVVRGGIIEEKIEDLLYSDTVVDNYAVVIDAGSTGSRVFVYKFSKYVYFNVTSIAEERGLMSSRNITAIPCGKRRPGLSSFASRPTGAVDYIRPLLMDAAAIIPVNHHETTKLYIKGTAGMRVLDELIQKQIWQVLIEGLNKLENFPFSVKKFSCYGTIDGYREAYYAVLSSNYIEGTIDGNLIPTPGKKLIGALDMGGGSTQLIFYNGSAGTDGASAQRVTQNDFWSHSWLGYGVEAIKEKVSNYLYDEYVYDTLYHMPHTVEYSANSEEFFSVPMPWYEVTTVIKNPCANPGYEVEYSPQLIMKGTGEGVKCIELIKKVVWPNPDEDHSCVPGQPCWVDEVAHPAVADIDFYAMSVYFYAFDCIRQLGSDSLDHWPNPSLAELEAATINFCAIPFTELQGVWVWGCGCGDVGVGMWVWGCGCGCSRCGCRYWWGCGWV